jgi:hypothetical protein
MSVKESNDSRTPRFFALVPMLSIDGTGFSTDWSYSKKHTRRGDSRLAFAAQIDPQ